MVASLTFLPLKYISGKKQIMELINDKICCYKCRPGSIVRFFLIFESQLCRNTLLNSKLFSTNEWIFHYIYSWFQNHWKKREYFLSSKLLSYKQNLVLHRVFFPWRWKDDVLEGAIILILQAIFFSAVNLLSVWTRGVVILEKFNKNRTDSDWVRQIITWELNIRFFFKFTSKIFTGRTRFMSYSYR